jgi:hypothetical protein
VIVLASVVSPYCTQFRQFTHFATWVYGYNSWCLTQREVRLVLIKNSNDTALSREIWTDRWRKIVMRDIIYIFRLVLLVPLYPLP